MRDGGDFGKKGIPEFATSFFEKCCLSQCSRGSREKTAIICSNHILENLDPRLECSDASLRVYPLSRTDARTVRVLFRRDIDPLEPLHESLSRRKSFSRAANPSGFTKKLRGFSVRNLTMSLYCRSIFGERSVAESSIFAYSPSK